ncbi:MAG: hypothetical protein M9934_07715 [Thermomicrobiales bacterium]|nr:hypothetical protein [Thermomicrobiales bacterium]
MNSPYDDDAFAMQFDDAINDMHQRHPEAPGNTIRQQIEARLSQANTADSRAHGPDLAAISSERMNGMDATLTSPTRGRSLEPSRGVSAWIAAAVVLMLVASGFYLNTLRPGDGGEQHLAWAPTATEDATLGDYTCTVTPLTADEVMAIILYPHIGYENRGSPPMDADFPQDYYETELSDIDNWTLVAMSPVLDPEQREVMMTLGNEFWNCLIIGTSYQVWAMMDPGMLQWSILKQFPVLRDEEQLRQFVEEFGPKLYTEGEDGTRSFGIFPNFLNQNPDDVAMVADEGISSIRVSKTRGEGDLAGAIGIITMVPANGEDPHTYYELYVASHPDGSWTVHWVMLNANTGRG